MRNALIFLSIAERHALKRLAYTQYVSLLDLTEIKKNSMPYCSFSNVS